MANYCWSCGKFALLNESTCMCVQCVSDWRQLHGRIEPTSDEPYVTISGQVTVSPFAY